MNITDKNRLISTKLTKIMFLPVLIISVFIGQFILTNTASYAAPVVGFDPANIIDDGIFTNANTMSVSQIQLFLNSKIASCDTNGTQPASDFGRPDLTHAQYAASRGWSAPPYTCLKDYSENGLNSAQIIYNLAQQYQINPQVLIVLMQKEQGLVTDTWPLPTEYLTAAGYGCPDTTGCAAKYYGLTAQLTWAATMFHTIVSGSSNWSNPYDSGTSWYTPYILGNNYIQYNPQSSCGGTTVNIQNRSTQALYNYTPYQPNAASLNAGYGVGDSCSSYGNRNFYEYFSDWFGSTKLPVVFKVNGDPSIYVQIAGYKFYIPTMSILQDYGLGSGAQTIPQSYANAIPLPGSSTGLSSILGNVVQSPVSTGGDGVSIYLISAGKKYLFRTVQQMADFGFSSANITYLPNAFLLSIPDGGVLSNYVTTTDSATNIFQVSSDSKRLILDNSTYQSLNSTNGTSQISTTLLSSILSGTPIGNNPILLSTNTGSYYLYTNSSYYYVPTPDVLNCWNFTGALGIGALKLTNDSDVATITSSSSLNCDIYVNGSTNYLLNGDSRIAIPQSYGFSSSLTPSDVVTVSSRLPIRAATLGQAIQASNSPTVWYLESGLKKGIPSLLDLKLLGITSSQIDPLLPGAVASLPGSGIKFGVGQIVRESDTGAIYVITSATSKRYISTPDTLNSYGYSWVNIPTFSSSLIDQYYTSDQSPLSKYMYTSVGGIYLMDANACYGLSSDQTVAYGQPSTINLSTQPYDSTIFPNVNLVNCKYGSLYVKGSSQGTVYLVKNGQKNPFASWSDLVTVSQQTNPYIITLDTTDLNSLPTGSVVIP